MSNLQKNFNGVAGLVVDPNGGGVRGDVLPTLVDGLTVTAKRVLEMREAALAVPHIGDWRVGIFEGGVNPFCVQLFPNVDRLSSAKKRLESAERVMGWFSGEWQRHMYTGRCARVKIGGHECVLVIHNVDGMVVKQPAAETMKGAPDHA